MKNKISIFIFLSFFLFSCNRQSLSEEEVSVINKFLTYEWYDLEMVAFSGETIPNEASFEFKVEGGKLRHVSNTYYSASFGDKHFQSEGDVNIYYDNESEGVALELLNEDGEILQQGIIKIPKEEIISGLEKQINYRARIVSILEKRKFNELTLGEFDQRGIFESKILRSFQSDDFSMNYVYDPEYHLEELGDFKPYKIEGFTSKAGQGLISWELKEIYKDSTEHEISFNDLQTSFDKEEVASLMSMLQSSMKFYDSNIASKESFNSNDFSIDFDASFSLTQNDEYSYGEELISELEIPITSDNYSFLKSWYAGEGNSLVSFEFIRNDENRFEVYINLNTNYETGGNQWMRIYKDNLDYYRVHFFNQNKYFTLISKDILP